MTQKKKETAKKKSLRKCLDDFMKKKNISEDQLEYHWKGLTARETDQMFEEFHTALETAVRNKKKDKICVVITAIVKWGGVTIGKRMLDEYPQKLLALDEDEPIGNEKRLASWTKVLAAYKPGKFCIYDSRVAFALRALMPEECWFLPPSRKTGNDRYNRLERKGQLSPRESYEKYMRLLEATDDRVKYERKLFMLGGVLADINVN